MKRLTTKTRFRIGTASILLIICTSVAAVVHLYLKNMATDRILRETEIFIGTADATRTYVKETLRPQMETLLPKDAFIPQAMSTTFVGRDIMRRLRERFPHFSYKRAALDPINPINKADRLECDMLQWFKDHPERSEWHGLIERNQRSYFARFRAIYAEAECLRCHGDPAVAPAKMLEIYGTDGGYNYQVGDVVAADTIYIPIDVTFIRIKEAAWNVFLIAGVSLVAFLGLFYIVFNRTVISEMKELLNRFHSIRDTVPTVEALPAVMSGDEFDQVKHSLEQVAEDLRATHHRLSASESKYRSLFETSRDPILITDARNRLVDINTAGCQLFGFADREEALSIETYFQLFWDTRQARSFRQKVEADGFVDGMETAMVNRHGDKLLTLASATGRTDPQGRLAGVDIRLHDITHRRQLELQMARTERLASIGQLASGVAHEINNPLGVIACYANLVAKSASVDEQVRNDIDIIQKHTTQCKSVVEALLNFARVSSPSKAPTDIGRCLKEVMEVLEPQMRKENIRRSMDLGNTPWLLTVDAAQIQQVFMNLVLNAIQAMTGGGELNVRIAPHADAGGIQVQITDTGMGIAEKNMNKVFDPFFTTKEQGKGTGLGLAVSYGIVHQHGGDIHVTSTVGKGTTITVRLPFETDGPTQGDRHDN